MTREVFQVEIPFGGSSIRIQRITERHSSPTSTPPSRPIQAHGVTVQGAGIVRSAIASIVPFPFRKSA